MFTVSQAISLSKRNRQGVDCKYHQFRLLLNIYSLNVMNVYIRMKFNL